MNAPDFQNFDNPGARYFHGDPAHALAAKVNGELLEALTDVVGEPVQVRGALSASDGLVTYGFPAEQCDISFLVLPFRQDCALLKTNVFLGRIVPGYWRAVRWLACNRAENTLALALQEHHFTRKELHLAGTRLTAPGDPVPMRALVMDLILEAMVCAEVLDSWFPQLVHGSWLRASGLDSSDAPVTGVSSQRRHTFPIAVSDFEQTPDVLCFLAKSAADWVGLVQHSRALEREAGVNKTPATALHAQQLRLRALFQLGRFEEGLELVETIFTSDPEESGSLVHANTRAAFLVRLGRFEEAVAELDPWDIEGQPRPLLWRECALAGLGLLEEAEAVRNQRTNLTGPDYLSDRMVAACAAQRRKGIE